MNKVEALKRLITIGSEMVSCLEQYDWDKMSVPMTPVAEMQLWRELVSEIEENLEEEICYYCGVQVDLHDDACPEKIAKEFMQEWNNAKRNKP